MATSLTGNPSSPLHRLSWPSEFAENLASQAEGILAHCPARQRQAVLDEAAAIYRRGRLRGNPIGLLRKLVELARNGRFVPRYGVRYLPRSRPNG